MSRILIAKIALGLSLAWGQSQDRVFLSSSTVVGGQGALLECDGQGGLVATHPGPALGSLRLIRDPWRRRVLTVEAAGTGIWVHDETTTRRTIFPTVGARDLAILPDRRAAVLLGGASAFAPGAIQVFDPSGGAWPAPIPLAADPQELVVTGSGTIWVRHGIQPFITRLSSWGQTQTIPLGGLSSTLASRISRVDAGGIAVSFLASGQVHFLDPSGASRGSVLLPESPIDLSFDQDRHLWVLGPTRVFVIDTPGLRVAGTVLLPAGRAWQSIHAAESFRFWLEESTTPSLSFWSGGGTMISSLTLPRPTATRGDPLGLAAALFLDPDGDWDQDGYANRIEFLRGSGLRNDQDTPPDLLVGSSVSGVIPLVVYARGAPNGIAMLLLGVSGYSLQGVGVGPDGGAPYFALNPDLLSTALLEGNPLLSPGFFNVPFLNLDSSGLGVAAVNLSALGLPPGSLNLSAAALVAGTITSHYATSNPADLGL